MSQAEREALLQKCLARHQTTLNSAQAAAPAKVDTSRITGEPRVLLFFVAGSDADRAAAEQQAELLWDRVAGLDLQPVPAVPTIRYDFTADRTAALALAQTTWAPGGKWHVAEMAPAQSDSILVRSRHGYPDANVLTEPCVGGGLLSNC